MSLRTAYGVLAVLAALWTAGPITHGIHRAWKAVT